MDPGVKIREARPADAEAIARVRVETWRTTYRGIIPDAFLDALSIPEKTDRYRQSLEDKGSKKFHFVAESGGKVVAFATGAPERTGNREYTGELDGVYVLEAFQGRGVGRCLVRAVVTRLAREGHRAMLVRVLAANPWRRFYETLKGIPLTDQNLKVAHVFSGVDCPVAIYGWKDLGAVAKCAEKAS